MSCFFHRCFCASLTVCALTAVFFASSSQAQPSEAQMEKALDIMDKSASSSWSGPAQGDAIIRANQMPPDLVNRKIPFNVAASSSNFNSPKLLTPQAGFCNTPQMLTPQAAVSNPFTLRNALHIMLGGSSASSTGGWVSGNDSDNLQTALDQKQQAIDACNNISGEGDKGVKEGLASQAQDHANAARYAADALYNSACNSKSQQVHDMASRARNAANEAQSFADRARSKADGGGW